MLPRIVLTLHRTQLDADNGQSIKLGRFAISSSPHHSATEIVTDSVAGPDHGNRDPNPALLAAGIQIKDNSSPQ